MYAIFNVNLKVAYEHKDKSHSIFLNRKIISYTTMAPTKNDMIKIVYI